MSRRLGAAMLVQFSCTPTQDADDDGAATASSTGELALECVAPMQADLALEMLPAVLFEEAPSQFGIHETCAVTEVVDDDPQRLAMTCPDGLGTLGWSLEVSPPSVPLADLFAIDQAVDLRYFAGGGNGPSDALPHQWATLRPPGDAAPLLVVANGALPGVYGSTLRTEIVLDTTCDGPPGCSGIGLTHRAAIEFTLDGLGSTIVFDRNDDEIGPYRIRVGEVIVDESPCDVSEPPPIEFVVMRSPAP